MSISSEISTQYGRAQIVPCIGFLPRPAPSPRPAGMGRPARLRSRRRGRRPARRHARPPHPLRGWTGWLKRSTVGWVLLSTPLPLPDAGPLRLSELTDYQAGDGIWFAAHRVSTQALDAP
ncbi:hypothetical protein DSL92_06770 [Billgrantia gudaonensis]|uniref:Uncharacterized protein n=1 Tax=Billgrantia gudaonensis TaxID=376427 RepID=A0A432JIJ0_9GAMM|nr:hypothetical protein DSL92_06770 [Halomonas gudaonensis]